LQIAASDDLHLLGSNTNNETRRGKLAMKEFSRRTFLGTAPVAAAAGLTLANTSMLSAFAADHNAMPAFPAGIQLFTAQTIQDDIRVLQAKPGNNDLVEGTSTPFSVILTVETAKTPKEFEWHEGRDHVLQIIEGSTVLEVGGTPVGGHSKGPGEWLAPGSEGAVSIALKKGDMLVIPRGTPHKRSTAESVTLLLISPMGTVKS
jgi:mannose-6-phosphate isomerase-like protein (cupin superfamily)